MVIPRLKSLQATEVSTELKGFENIIGVVYQSRSKPLEEEDSYIFIGPSMNNKFIFGGDLNSKPRLWNYRLGVKRRRKLLGHAERNNISPG